MNRNMKAITWGLEVRGLDPGPWRILMVLCSHVGKEGYNVWPSFKTMAEKAEISRGTAKRYVAELIERGFIEQVEERFRENGGRSTNVYRILVGEIDVMDAGPDEEDQYLSASDPRVNLDRGGSQSYDSSPRSTVGPCREPLKVRTSKLEETPLPTEEPPLEDHPDLLGDRDLATRPPLIDHVLAGWKAIVADHPRVQAIRAVNEARKKKIVARARELAQASGLSTHQVWDQVFRAIRGSEFLRGDAPPTKNYPQPFSLSIDYILRPAEFLRTLERAVTDADHNRVTSDPATGRRFGPAEQAMREAIERRRASRQPGR